MGCHESPMRQAAKLTALDFGADLAENCRSDKTYNRTCRRRGEGEREEFFCVKLVRRTWAPDAKIVADIDECEIRTQA